MAVSQPKTYEDLMATPNDGFRYELVRGEILRMPPPKGKPGRIEAKLVGAIERYLQDRARARGWSEDQDGGVRDRLVGCTASGEFGIRFSLPTDPEQTRGVDICYLSPEQVAAYELAGADEYFPGVPTLVAEVVSPSEGADYINQKVTDYLDGGARAVWLVFPGTRTVHVYRPGRAIEVLTSADMLDGADVLPEFSLTVGTLFV